MLGAILIVASKSRIDGISSDSGELKVFPSLIAQERREERFASGPLACMDVLGRSTLDRMVDLFRRAVGDAVVVINDRSISKRDRTFSGKSFGAADDAWDLTLRALKRQREDGIRATFIMRVGAYVEFDPFDMFQFHVEQRQGVTRAFQQKDLLDLWVVNTADIGDNEDISKMLQMEEAEGALYPLSGYVNQLAHPRDLRRLVSDSFASVCQMRPQGKEVRSRVWLDDGARVSPKTRIVGPAYIGRGTRIREHCLITRGSNIEKDCEIDYGTVVEDSSICANTYVGLCLDVSHSVANGNKLLNLERDLILEMNDAGVIREKTSAPADDLMRMAAFARTWADRFVDGGMEFKKVF